MLVNRLGHVLSNRLQLNGNGALMPPKTSTHIRPEEAIPTRHSLLRRMKNWEDRASWEDFFQTYRKLIYGVAIRAGLTDAEAQDVLQETVMTVAKNIKNFEVGSERGSFKAWLRQNTRWRIADQFRKRPPFGPRKSDLRDDASPTAIVERTADPASLSVETLFDQEWKQNLADTALANLRGEVDPGQYQMFDLHVLKHWPAVKVARKLNVKMGRVYFAKYKISRLLKKEIRRLEARIN
jgi:RNA polymerase sigma factor (sigma-70 family)